MDLYTLTTDELNELTTDELDVMVVIYRPPLVYISDGRLIYVSGCGVYDVSCKFLFTFNVGDFVYSTKKALMKGVLEKYCIKKIKYYTKEDSRGHQMCKFGPDPYLYMDTQNDFHEEVELCTREEALNLIEQYLLYQHEQMLRKPC